MRFKSVRLAGALVLVISILTPAWTGPARTQVATVPGQPAVASQSDHQREGQATAGSSDLGTAPLLLLGGALVAIGTFWKRLLVKPEPPSR